MRFEPHFLARLFNFPSLTCYDAANIVSHCTVTEKCNFNSPFYDVISQTITQQTALHFVSVLLLQFGDGTFPVIHGGEVWGGGLPPPQCIMLHYVTSTLTNWPRLQSAALWRSNCRSTFTAQRHYCIKKLFRTIDSTLELRCDLLEKTDENSSSDALLH